MGNVVRSKTTRGEGLVPRWGRRRGVAESAVPIRHTKPQLRLFIPWCAGASRHERLVRKSRYAGPRVAAYHRPRTCQPDLPFVIPAKAGIQKGWGWERQRHPNATSGAHPFSYLGVPAAAGMSDWYENRPLRLLMVLMASISGL